MALPLLAPFLKGATTMLIRGKLKRIAKDKIRESGKTGIEAAREYGKMTGQQFKRFDIDPITKQAVAKYYAPTITGFDKGLMLGAGTTAVAMSGNNKEKKPISKKEKAMVNYKKKMQQTHEKYGIK